MTTPTSGVSSGDGVEIGAGLSRGRTGSDFIGTPIFNNLILIKKRDDWRSPRPLGHVTDADTWLLYSASVQRQEAEVEPIKVTLCEECPEVEITDQGVTIGEDENIVRLSHAEWNELVRLIKDGKLQEVWKLKTSAAST